MRRRCGRLIVRSNWINWGIRVLCFGTVFERTVGFGGLGLWVAGRTERKLTLQCTRIQSVRLETCAVEVSKGSEMM